MGRLWRTGRADLAAVGAILLAVLTLFQDAILRGWIYYEFDTTIYYFPLAKWLASALSEARVPLWSPHIYGGFPLFADGEGAVFYPPNLVLLRLLGAEQGFIWLQALHFFMAGAFTYAFVRLLQPGRVPALIAGLTFSLGSFMITQMHHVNVVGSAAWLPVILFWIELALRAKGRRRVRYTAIAGASFGMQLLTMHIQPVLMTIVTVFAYVAFRALADRELAIRRTAGALWILAAVLLLGGALSAIQILPLAELSTQAQRADSSYEFGSTFAIAPPNLLTVLFPYFFRLSGYDYWSLWFRWETTLYLGIVPLLLGLIALLALRTRQAFFFGFLGLLGLLLALGDYSPVNLYWLWWHVPGFDFLRAPGRFTLVVTFSGAVLAGLGASYLQRALVSGANRVLVTRVAVSVLATAALGSASVWMAGAWVRNNRQAALQLIDSAYLSFRHQTDLALDPALIYQALVATLSPRNPRTMLAIVLMIGAGLVLLAWQRWEKRRPLWQMMVVGLVAADLLSFAMIYHPQTPIAELSPDSDGVAGFLALRRGQHRIYNRQPVGSTSQNQLLPLAVEAVGGYSSLVGRRYSEYRRSVAEGNPRLLDLWNVRYVVSPKTSAPPGSPERFRPVYEDRDSVVYENSRYLPRAFFTTGVVVADSEQSALRLIKEPAFNPRQAVVLERGDAGATNVETSRPARGAGRARIVEYGDDRIEIEVNAAADGYLVITDSFDQGWQASVNGRRAEILRADYLFRGLALPRGRHRVVLEYAPPSLVAGKWISLLTAAALVLAAPASYAVSRLRARKRARHRSLAIGSY